MHSTAVPVSLCLSPLQIFNSFSHRQSASVALAQQFLSSLTSALRAASHIYLRDRDLLVGAALLVGRLEHVLGAKDGHVELRVAQPLGEARKGGAVGKFLVFE